MPATYRIQISFITAVKGISLNQLQHQKCLEVAYDLVTDTLEGEVFHFSLNPENLDTLFILDLPVTVSPANAGHKIKRAMAAYVKMAIPYAEKKVIWKHDLNVSTQFFGASLVPTPQN